jgi:hypothetical protein
MSRESGEFSVGKKSGQFGSEFTKMYCVRSGDVRSVSRDSRSSGTEG